MGIIFIFITYVMFTPSRPFVTDAPPKQRPRPKSQPNSEDESELSYE